MVVTLTPIEVATLAIAMAASVSHVYTGVLGFQLPRHHRPAQLMFLVSMLVMAWTTAGIGLAVARADRFIPAIVVSAPLLSGYGLPCFYLFCRSAVYPRKPLEYRWILFGLFGTVFAVTAMILPGTLANISTYVRGGDLGPYTIALPLFVLTSACHFGFAGATVFTVAQGWRQTNDPAQRKTLAWLAWAMVVVALLLITDVAMPLFGFVDLMWTAPLTTMLLAALVFRALRSLGDPLADARKQQLEERSNRLDSLGRMARGIAHDFNNMLAGMLGYAELARNTIEPEHPAQDHLANLVEISRTAGELNQRLLLYSGQGLATAAPMDPTPIVEEAIRALAPITPPRVTMEAALPARLPMVAIRPADLAAILTNLLSNARDAIAAGNSGHIEVRVTSHEAAVIPSDALGGDLDGHPALEFQVKDNGEGMTSETAARVLEPFFTTRATGRGLGLSNVLSSIREAGGALAYDSVVSRGSVFRFWLPTIEAQPTGNGGDSDHKHIPIKARPLLVVEDNDDVRAVTLKILEILGYEAHGVTNGEAALSWLDGLGNSAAILLLDVQLPGIDGIEIAQQALTLQPRHLVIMMSGDEPGARIGELTSTSPIQLLRKPFSMSQLQSSLNALAEDVEPG